MRRTALERAYREALRVHLLRRPDPQAFWGRDLDALDAHEEALDVWRTELVRLEAALRARTTGGERR